MVEDQKKSLCKSVTVKLTVAYCLRKAPRVRLTVSPMQWGKTTRRAGELKDEAAGWDRGFIGGWGCTVWENAHGWSRHASICTAGRVTWLKYGNTDRQETVLTNVAPWFKLLAEQQSVLWAQLRLHSSGWDEDEWRHSGRVAGQDLQSTVDRGIWGEGWLSLKLIQLN